MRFFWIVTFSLFFGSARAAEPIILNLTANPRHSSSATELWVDLVALNPGASDQHVELPTQLAADLRVGATTWRVELQADASSADAPAGLVVNGDVAIRAGGFVRRSYRLITPAAASGLAVLEIHVAGQPVLRTALDMPANRDVAAVPESRPEVSRPQKPTTNLARARPAAAELERTPANRMAPHEAVYFVYGPDAPAAKFQFSFKYKLLGFDDGAPGKMAQTLQFGFTQRSLWDIGGVSSPFYDTSYMPELIYESLAAEPDESDRWFTWLGFQASLKHESNGRAGPLSRSLNTAYVRPVLAFGALDGWHLLVIPEVWAYLDSLEDNSDLKNYRGYGQLRLIFGRNGGPSLMAKLWAGKNFDHSSAQLDLTVPVKTQLLDFQVYLLLQYFNGYGESLLSYQQKTETVRAGFSFVR